MKFLVSGYFGFRNAGDEAVLAAMLGHLRAESPNAQITATSGDPVQTRTAHGCDAIGRESLKEILGALRDTDVFISGGGSLVQDVTSVRNVVYYTGLMRLARFSRKPVMIYAQGVGPLARSISRKLARFGFSSASVITVRDPDSAALLREIGVRRDIEITADPVWDLAPAREVVPATKTWVVALRSWPGAEQGTMALLVEKLRAAADTERAKLRFLPMQPGRDHEILHGLASFSEVIDTTRLAPREVLAEAGSGSLMVAMRLHALIFAASQGIPVVALNYDPKVAALAGLIGAPLVESSNIENLKGLDAALHSARPAPPETLLDLKGKARRNAKLATALGKKS